MKKEIDEGVLGMLSFQSSQLRAKGMVSAAATARG